MSDSPLIQIQIAGAAGTSAGKLAETVEGWTGLEGKTGKQYWRSLEEFSNTPQFNQWVEREFPSSATEMVDGASRRNVLKLMAASFGLAGLTACRRPVENILPNVSGIEDYIPGKPVFYASAMTLGGVGQGLLVEVNDGRPTKVEGNPQHPYSLGAANGFHQASILSLYDPDRLNTPRKGSTQTSWDDFNSYIKSEFGAAKLGDGSGFRILSESIASPSLTAVRDFTLQKFPKAKWVEYESLPNSGAAGAQLAFGQNVIVRPRLDKADVIVALDADFLGQDSSTVVAQKEFSRNRRIASSKDEMNRLYVVESQYSVTGATADHRLRMRSADVAQFAQELMAALGGATTSGGDEKRRRLVDAVAKDLNANRGKSLVIAGPRQPAEVHALAHAMNQQLGNAGVTVSYYQPLTKAATTQIDALKELAGELASGKVNALVVLGGNPAFTAPADLDFPANIKKAANSVYLGIENDETAAACKWAIPGTLYLESWGDTTAPDGTATIQQPTIAPLFDGKMPAELIAQISGYKDQKAYDIVKNFWLPKLGGEKNWRKALHEGVIPNTAFAEVKPMADPKRLSAPAAGQGMEVVFVQSSSVYDGRFANNAWLQEAADPMTKIVWDNSAQMSAATAKQLGVVDGDMIAIERNGRTLEIPATIQPGHADNSITIPVGYGRTVCGRVGTDVGFNAYKLRTTDAFGFGTGFNVKKAAGTHVIAKTQDHWTVDELGRKEEQRRAASLIREATLEEYKKEGNEFVKKYDEHPPLLSLYEHPQTYDKGYQWGMAIDLTSCIGCNACVIACQAENNIPVVGKNQVIRGREMHWIRIDRYYKGSIEDPQIATQPITCMQCEQAPCENVCPVAATTHSPEGLNDMAYNRCVGTRYCSNNCPYKVRRFNFLNWHKATPELEKLSYNPDVTVRMRGIMEKCTYCVQRIQEVKITAKAEGRRRIADGEIVPACAQTCPTDAIVFGDVNDPATRVAKTKAQDRNYALLEELNTRPRTTYLAKLRNPNPELEEQHG